MARQGVNKKKLETAKRGVHEHLISVCPTAEEQNLLWRLELRRGIAAPLSPKEATHIRICEHAIRLAIEASKKAVRVSREQRNPNTLAVTDETSVMAPGAPL